MNKYLFSEGNELVVENSGRKNVEIIDSIKYLKNGDIDLNAFQHYAFLNAWNKANKGNLQAIGNTVISPIRIYSKKIKTLNDVKPGAIIAIPNDPTNGGRALLLLQTNGIINIWIEVTLHVH